MDGYAIRAGDVARPGGGAHTPRGHRGGPRRAGPNITVRRGKAVRIARRPSPAGAEAMVPWREDAWDAAGAAAGPRRRDATGPLPAGILVRTPSLPVARSGAPAATSPRVTDPGGGNRAHAGGDRVAAGVGLDQLSVIAAPSSGSWRPATRSGSPARSSVRPASRANGPRLVAMVEAAGGDRGSSGSPRTAWTTSSRASTRGSSRAPMR